MRTSSLISGLDALNFKAVKPLVSILIPAYNAERWIADTIRSALAQTWPHKEIIVIDDGSTDRTRSIVEKFGSEGVSLVTQENRGVCAARNRAYEISQGDYIQWLDADDLLSPNKIAKQMEAAKEHQSRRTLFSCPWGYFIFRVNKARFVPTSLWCDLSPLEWLQRRWEQNLHMNPATWLTSRELSDAAGPWDTQLVGGGIEDGEYFSRVILAANGLEGVNLQRKEPADLVITDLFMPEQDGVETMMQLRKFAPNVGVIAISGNPLGSELFELVQPTSTLSGEDLLLNRSSTIGER